ncbi:hypothetical protein AKJ63_00815 [candidate division MSBL1 archaeon SCGC-AAA259D18]|uniref:Uncharacterized protein n=1 Tax=candidate division MSBL1 archaeon SCGC-AAA259D18 TaxID=1698262 RepID=A0A133UC79_9EURY|nr:hypothetical protein AKJ63_00815 [candidate division MSBL1 archaeon SCGC-AAA259D18]
MENLALKNLLESDEEVEWEGPEVKYDDKDYDSYITSNRLVFYKERGFFSKSEDIVSWDLESIDHVTFERDPATGTVGETVIMKIGDEEIEVNCHFKELPNFVAELRKRSPTG